MIPAFQSFAPLEAADATRAYLQKMYEQRQLPQPEKNSYKNSYPFLYYWTFGRNYYEQALQSPLEIKPMLLFYGMVHVMKAVLLTADPDYPSYTSVLAHGVSTRKRKKRHYRFVDDEVKLQKNGLLSHFSDKMFHMKLQEGKKMNMTQLLYFLPEMYRYLGRQDELVPIKNNHTLIELPSPTIEGLKKYMSENKHFEITPATKKGTWHVILNRPLDPLKPFPFLRDIKGNWYFPKHLSSFSERLPELIIHYLLLYNISMISRYETTWWGELLHDKSTNDFPIIKQFLQVTAQKGPQLLALFLHK